MVMAAPAALRYFTSDAAGLGQELGELGHHALSSRTLQGRLSGTSTDTTLSLSGIRALDISIPVTLVRDLTTRACVIFSTMSNRHNPSNSDPTDSCPDFCRPCPHTLAARPYSHHCHRTQVLGSTDTATSCCAERLPDRPGPGRQNGNGKQLCCTL